MKRFSLCPAPEDTPWGKPDHARQLLPGIWEVRTRSHGGAVLSAERQAAMPRGLCLASGCYEEDVDWSLVVLAFEAEYRASSLRCADLLADVARASVKAWHPERYAAFTGEAVPGNESPALRRRAALLHYVGQYIVCSASGDWADWVPEGKVGVVARRLARVDATGFACYEGEPIHGLVPRERYDGTRIVNGFDALEAVRVTSTAPVTKEIAL